MKLQAPPYGEIALTSKGDIGWVLDRRMLEAFAESWPTYREVLQELFTDYEHDNLFEMKQTRLSLEKIVPRKDNQRADLLLRFSFDDSGITWDIFQKGREVVHAQPVF